MFSQSCRPTPGLCRARVWVITPLSEAQGCRFFVFVQFRCAAPSATPTGTLFVLNIVQGYIRDCVLSCVFLCCTCLLSAKHFSPLRGCKWCHLPFRVFVVSSSNPPMPMVRGMFSASLLPCITPLLPFVSTKVCLVIVPFLWFVWRRIFPVPHPRHTGGTRQVFDGWLLPCCRVCVSFNCYSSRVPGSIARPLEVWWSGF